MLRQKPNAKCNRKVAGGPRPPGSSELGCGRLSHQHQRLLTGDQRSSAPSGVVDRPVAQPPG
jgi:hypothetical protein